MALEGSWRREISSQSVYMASASPLIIHTKLALFVSMAFNHVTIFSPMDRIIRSQKRNVDEELRLRFGFAKLSKADVLPC